MLLLYILVVTGVIYILYIVEQVLPFNNLTTRGTNEGNRFEMLLQVSYYLSLITETLGLPLLLLWTEYVITVLERRPSGLGA